MSPHRCGASLPAYSARQRFSSSQMRSFVGLIAHFLSSSSHRLSSRLESETRPSIHGDPARVQFPGGAERLSNESSSESTTLLALLGQPYGPRGLPREPGQK